MIKKTIAAAVSAIMIFMFASCALSNAQGDGQDFSALTSETVNSKDTASGTSSESGTTQNTVTDKDMFSVKDVRVDYTDETYTTVTLADGKSSADSDSVTIDGDAVTITAAGTYLFTGSLSDGQIIVEAAKEEKVWIILDGVDICCKTSAALYVRSADKVFLTLAEDSVNSLSNTSEFIAIDDNSIDSVIFSKDDLTINGSGSLTVNAVYGHGVVSKDDLVITGGTLNITAKNHAILGKNSVRISDGYITAVSGKDAIHSENNDDTSLGYIYISGGTFDLTADGDGIDGMLSVTIGGGTFEIKAGGGNSNGKTHSSDNTRPGAWGTTTTTTDTASTKGIKSDGLVKITAGNITVDSADDTLHSNTYILIEGCIMNMTSGDDGIHAGGAVTINGGMITVGKSYEGIEGKTITFNGGETYVAASDDGINGTDGSSSGAMGGSSSGVYVRINGGMLTVNSSGDGVDSNGSLYVTGGSTYVSGPTNSGNGAVDYNGGAQITGGIFIAAGSSGMAQNFGTTSTQGSILVNSNSNQQAGSVITVSDSSGNVLASYTPEKTYNSVVISCPGLVTGSTYTLTMGSTTQQITLSSLIYGSGSGMGGMGGMGGGGRH